jgi:hypothetical protein
MTAKPKPPDYETIEIEPTGPVLTEAEYGWVQGEIESNAEEFVDSLSSHQARELNRILRPRIAHAKATEAVAKKTARNAAAVRATRK